jgi:hypothetical protein
MASYFIDPGHMLESRRAAPALAQGLESLDSPSHPGSHAASSLEVEGTAEGHLCRRRTIRDASLPAGDRNRSGWSEPVKRHQN